MTARQISKTADFVIVGGGTAGLYLLTDSPKIRVLKYSFWKAEKESLKILQSKILALGRAYLVRRLLGSSRHPAVRIKQSRGEADPGQSLGRFIHDQRLCIYCALQSWYRCMSEIRKSKIDLRCPSSIPQKVYTIDPPDTSICKTMGVDYFSDTDTSTPPNGPLQVSFPSLPQKNHIAKAWNEILKDMGCETTADIFPTQSAGNRCYAAAIDPQTKSRMSADSQYGERASQRPNLAIMTEATVLRVYFSGQLPRKMAAESVEVLVSGETRSIKADEEIILSAGVFHTAKTLELSGVGEASRLRNLDVPVIIETAGVGENLQNHVMCMRTFELEKNVKVGDGIQSLAFLPLKDRTQHKETFDDNEPPATSNERDFYSAARAVLDSLNEAVCSVFMTFIGLPNFASLGVMQSIPFSRWNSHIVSARLDDNPEIDPTNSRHSPPHLPSTRSRRLFHRFANPEFRPCSLGLAAPLLL